MELTADQWMQSLWMALRRIEENLATPPAPLELPEIRIDPPDLTAIVTAVTSLNGTGPTADEIARAIAAVIAPPPAATSGGAEALEAVARALEKLDFRMQGMGKQAYGGGSSQLQAQRPDGTWGPAQLNTAGELVVTTTAGGGGGTASSVTINDPTVTAQKLAVDVNGRIGVNNFPGTQTVSGTVTANAGTGTMAVSGPLTDTQLRAAAVPVSGTVTVANPTANPETGLAKDATLTGGTQKTKIVDTAGTNVATVSAAGAVKIDGSAVTQPVSGTFFQATQPVSLATAPVTPVTDNAGSLTVDSTQLPAALAAGGGIKVEGVAGGVAQPVSGTFWQATQPVSGTVTANAGTGSFTVAQATAANLNAAVTGTGSAGTAATGVVTVQGIAGGVAQPVTIASAPVIQTAPPPVGNKKATYAACANFAPAASATDIFTIYGSATKTVVIEKLIIDGIQTTAGSAQFFVIKRSAANTGGTSAAPTRVPYDANDAAATATVLNYTANPTALGTAVGNIRSDRIFLPAAATAVDAQGRIFLLGDEDMKGVVLRGTAQGMAVNLNAVTVTGGSVNINIEWTEE